MKWGSSQVQQVQRWWFGKRQNGGSKGTPSFNCHIKVRQIRTGISSSFMSIRELSWKSKKFWTGWKCLKTQLKECLLCEEKFPAFYLRNQIEIPKRCQLKMTRDLEVNFQSGI